MKKQERPKFYAMHKDFNDGEMKPYNVLSAVFEDILTPKDRLVSKYFYIVDRNYKKVKIRTKEQCAEYVKDKLMYHFWGNASWEFIAIDWPYRKTIDESRPVKIDVYEQIEPNLSLIVDLVWNYLEPKVAKLK